MTRAERIADWCLFAYLSAVLTLMLLPVFMFMVALKCADWIDAWVISSTSTDENTSSSG